MAEKMSLMNKSGENGTETSPGESSEMFPPAPLIMAALLLGFAIAMGAREESITSAWFANDVLAGTEFDPQVLNQIFHYLSHLPDYVHQLSHFAM
jgi:hypothetical protein